MRTRRVFIFAVICCLMFPVAGHAWFGGGSADQKEAVRERKIPKKIDRVYKDALSLYRIRHYDASRDKIGKIKEMLDAYTLDPRYKDNMDKKALWLSKVIAKAEKRDQERRLQEIDKSRNISNSRRQRFIQKEIRENANKSYTRAVNLYKNKEFDLAEEEVRKLNGYLLEQDLDEKFAEKLMKKSDWLYDRIQAARVKEAKRQAYLVKKRQRIIEKDKEAREKRMEQLADYATRSGSQREKRENEYVQKLVKFEQEEIAGSADSSKKYLDQKKERINLNFIQRLSALYERGVALFKMKEYRRAEEIFSEISVLEPHFKATDKYLESVRAKSRQKAERRKIKAKELTREKTRDEYISETLDMMDQ